MFFCYNLLETPDVIISEMYFYTAVWFPNMTYFEKEVIHRNPTHIYWHWMYDIVNQLSYGQKK